MKRFNDEAEVERILADYRDGVLLKTMKEKYGRSMSSISMLAHSRGLAKRTPKEGRGKEFVGSWIEKRHREYLVRRSRAESRSISRILRDILDNEIGS